MITRDELTSFLDGFLASPTFRDYGPNGLQVEGRAEVRKVALGVSASLALLERAAAWGADAVIVHHGLFWRGPGELCIERSLRARLKVLLDRDVNLLGYHLPLDAHPEVGNNAVLARRLGADRIEPAFEYEGQRIGVVARFDAPRAAGELFLDLARAVGRDPLVVPAGPAEVRSVGIVSGGAPRLLEDAVRARLDAFVTGEAAEHVVHLAREEHIHFVAAGHHATERFGVQALRDLLEERFGLECRYIEIGNPV